MTIYAPIGNVPDVFHYCWSCWQPITAAREAETLQTRGKALCLKCALPGFLTKSRREQNTLKGR